MIADIIAASKARHHGRVPASNRCNLCSGAVNQIRKSTEDDFRATRPNGWRIPGRWRAGV